MTRLFALIPNLLAAALIPATAAAATIQLDSSIVAHANSTGSFEVLLLNDGPDPIEIGSFSFEISTGFPQIQFQGASIATTVPYLYAGDSLFAPDLAISTGQTLLASDSPLSGAAAMIASGQQYSLGRITYEILGSAGLGTVTIQFGTIATSLSDAVGNPVTINTIVPGSMTVLNEVPEPRVSLLLGAALIAVARFRPRRARG